MMRLRRRTLASLWCIQASVGLPHGSGGRIRTYDQRINSPLRYRCATPDHHGAGELAGHRRQRNRPPARPASMHLHHMPDEISRRRNARWGGGALAEQAACKAPRHLRHALLIDLIRVPAGAEARRDSPPCCGSISESLRSKVRWYRRRAWCRQRGRSARLSPAARKCVSLDLGHGRGRSSRRTPPLHRMLALTLCQQGSGASWGA